MARAAISFAAPAALGLLTAVLAAGGDAGAPAAGARAAGDPAAVSASRTCRLFPPSFSTNRRVDGLPVAAGSDAIVASMGRGEPVHADFGAGRWNGGAIGIPYQVVRASRMRRSRVAFDYASESDRVRYPIPRRPRIEAGSDHHALFWDRERCRLYELFALRRSGGGWRAGSGAVWNLRSTRLRPRGWTSADAAGLPILPLLARHQEVRRGRIRHALRITASRTRSSFVHPARHAASDSSDPSLPRMGERLRLKASVDVSGLPRQARVVVRAMREYGVIVADNGADWFVGGAPGSGWDDDQLHALGGLTGDDFEVVDARSLRP